MIQLLISVLKKILLTNVYTGRSVRVSSCFWSYMLMMLATNDLSMMYQMKEYPSISFEMKDMGKTSYVIEIEMHRDRLQGLFRENLYQQSSREK